MDKGSNARVGKVVTAGHCTRVEGLNRFLGVLEPWPEITSIRLGEISTKKARSAGGGFSFKATRRAVVGTTVTGIKCFATYGRSMQEIVLCGDDLDALARRLRAAGYVGKNVDI